MLCLLRLSPSLGDVVPWAQVSHDFVVTVSPLETCLLPHSEQRGQTPTMTDIALSFLWFLDSVSNNCEDIVSRVQISSGSPLG